jgi:hypothetical protein
MALPLMAALTLTLTLALECAPGGDDSDTLVLSLRGNTGGPPLSAAAIRYEPAGNVLSARLSSLGWLAIERRHAARALTVRIPELCPVTVPAGPQAQPIALRPVIDLGAERAPVGFDSRFTIVAQRGCTQSAGRIAWRQLEGVPLSELAIAQDGFVLSARTPRFEVVHPEPLSDGIVPISPRTQGRTVLEARWSAAGAAPIRRTIVINATSRATGVPSVAVSQQLLLSGVGWRVQHAPQAGHAQVHDSGAFSLFSPDAPGRWAFERGPGQALSCRRSGTTRRLTTAGAANATRRSRRTPRAAR